MGKSKGEEILLWHITAMRLPLPEREYRFAPPRKWRFDFAYPKRKLAIEIEGGIWSNGRHTRSSGYIKDMAKYNEAARLGWQVLRFTTEQAKSGYALQVIEDALRSERFYLEDKPYSVERI